MSDPRNRIIQALDSAKISRQQLADKLGLGRGAVSAKLTRDTEFDSIKYLEATAELTGYSFEWLRTGIGPEKGTPSSNDTRQLVLKYEKQIEDLVAQIAEKNAQLELRKKNEELLTKLNQIQEGQLREKQKELDELRAQQTHGKRK